MPLPSGADDGIAFLPALQSISGESLTRSKCCLGFCLVLMNDKLVPACALKTCFRRNSLSGLPEVSDSACACHMSGDF